MRTKFSDTERPIYKAMQNGSRTLTDSELIAMILAVDSSVEAVENVKKLTGQYTLDEISRFTSADIRNVSGLSHAASIRLKALFDFSSRRIMSERAKDKVTSSKEAAAHFHFLSDLTHEEFWIMALNRNNVVIGKYHIGTGSVSGVVVDPKIIFKKLVDTPACSSFIAVHNHPSGNDKPSDADKALTRKLKEGGKLLDILMLDSVIIAGNVHYSFADDGEM